MTEFKLEWAREENKVRTLTKSTGNALEKLSSIEREVVGKGMKSAGT